MNNIKKIKNTDQNININNILITDIDFSWLPEKVMQQYSLLPLHNYRVIMAESSNITARQAINFYSPEPCEIYTADPSAIDEKIASILYHQESQYLLKHDQKDQQIYNNMTDYIEKLFLSAINKKASDIHIDTDKSHVYIRFRIDGILYLIEKLAKSMAPQMITHLKVLAKLDITEKRLPQDGRLHIHLARQQQKVDCRISTSPTIYEEKIVLRLLNINQQPLEIASLGLTEEQKILLLSVLAKPQGMILVTGPTGSGKTITLYTALNLLNKPSVNILSVEDPIEIELAGINQTQIHEKIDFTFAKALRAFLRQDPDIIMVGEMRDKETADIAIKAAQTGHLVLSTLHTNSAIETLSRLKNMGIPSYDICSSVSLIIAQRLIRCLCPICKIPDPLVPGAYKATSSGCSDCQQGYTGRTGIYEFLPMTTGMAELVLTHSPSYKLEAKALEEGMKTLYSQGQEKIKTGITAVSELSRVLRSC